MPDKSTERAPCRFQVIPTSHLPAGICTLQSVSPFYLPNNLGSRAPEARARISTPNFICPYSYQHYRYMFLWPAPATQELRSGPALDRTYFLLLFLHGNCCTYIHTTCVLCRAVVLYLAAHRNSESRALFHHLLCPVASHFAQLGHCIRVKGSSSAAWVVPTLHCQRMQSTCRTTNRLRLTIQSLSGC